MVDIEIDEVTTLWNETSQNSWLSMRDTLLYYRSSGRLFPDETLVKLIRGVEYFQSTGEPFPTSPYELYNLLRSRV